MRMIAEQLGDVLSGFFVAVCLMVPAIVTFFVVRRFVHSVHRKMGRNTYPGRIPLPAAPRRIIENRTYAAPKLALKPLAPQKPVIPAGVVAAGSLKPRRNGYRVFLGSVGVYGYGLDEAPFHEEAILLDMNATSAVLQLTLPVREGQNLLLTDDRMSEDHICRIVHVSNPVMRPIEVTVELPGPCADFWRIFSRAASANGASSAVVPPSGDQPSAGGSIQV